MMSRTKIMTKTLNSSQLVITTKVNQKLKLTAFLNNLCLAMRLAMPTATMINKSMVLNSMLRPSTHLLKLMTCKSFQRPLIISLCSKESTMTQLIIKKTYTSQIILTPELMRVKVFPKIS